MSPCLSTKLKVLYYPVPKVAGTSIRHALFEADNGFAYRDMLLGGKKIELNHIYGAKTTPFVPAKPAAGVAKIAVVRDPLERLVSVYRNRVLYYNQTKSSELTKFKVDPGLPPKPDIETFVMNLHEYRKVPGIAHHTNPHVHFLGKDLDYFDRVFRFEQLAEFEAWLSARAKKPVRLPKLRTEGPEIPPSVLSARATKRVYKLYAHDYTLLKGIYPTQP